MIFEEIANPGAPHGERFGQDYVNGTPTTDPTEALGLLKNRRPRGWLIARHLMPYPILGPSPGGVSRDNIRYTPFIEHVFRGRKSSDICGTHDYMVTAEVADELIREGWVEETSRVNVFKISPLGIAVYVAWRKKIAEQETALTSAPSSD